MDGAAQVEKHRRNKMPVKLMRKNGAAITLRLIVALPQSNMLVSQLQTKLNRPASTGTNYRVRCSYIRRRARATETARA